MQVVQLQRENLARNVSDQEKEQQGFVSVETPIDELKEITGGDGILVGRRGEEVTGYLIYVNQKYCDKYPLLKPFIEQLTDCRYKDKLLLDSLVQQSIATPVLKYRYHE